MDMNKLADEILRIAEKFPELREERTMTMTEFMMMHRFRLDDCRRTVGIYYTPQTGLVEELVLGCDYLYNPDKFGVAQVRDERLRAEKECAND